MVKLMEDLSKRLILKISLDLSSATFSQALEAGLTHCNWLAGPQIGQSGQEGALASHSVVPEKVKGLMMSATYGPLFGGSSPSEDLQSCLESRLRRRMDVNGSPEYALTWKYWDMQSGPRICRLQASARRTKGTGYSGWRTPVATDGKGGIMNYRRGANARKKLRDQVSGLIQSSSDAQTEKAKGYLLNPLFSCCFLMGYPLYWGLCGMKAALNSKRR